MKMVTTDIDRSSLWDEKAKCAHTRPFVLLLLVDRGTAQTN